MVPEAGVEPARGGTRLWGIVAPGNPIYMSGVTTDGIVGAYYHLKGG